MVKPRKQIVGSKKQQLLIKQLQARERELLTQLRNKDANKHASDHFGVTIEQMAGRTKYALFHPLSENE